MGILTELINPVSDLLEKIIPDNDKRAEIAHEIATMAERQAHTIALAQIEVNKTEAASGNVFTGGWRPFMGWVCGGAFAYHFVVQPVAVFVLAYAGIEAPPLPLFDMGQLLSVLGGLLGLGSLRTFEKYKGLSK